MNIKFNIFYYFKTVDCRKLKRSKDNFKTALINIMMILKV